MFLSVLSVALLQEVFNACSGEVVKAAVELLVDALQGSPKIMFLVNCTAGLHRRGPGLCTQGALN
jgi:hypothetical protein